MRQRIEAEPVGFVAAVRLTLLAFLGIAVGAGWHPDFDVATVVIIPVVGAVEGWTTWWARTLVTPEVKARERVALAEAQAHVEGYHKAEDDVAKLDNDRLDPAPQRARK